MAKKNEDEQLLKYDKKWLIFPTIIIVLLLIFDVYACQWVSENSSHNFDDLIVLSFILLTVFIVGLSYWSNEIMGELHLEGVMVFVIVGLLLMAILVPTLPQSEKESIARAKELKIISYPAINSLLQFNDTIVIITFNDTGNYTITFESNQAGQIHQFYASPQTNLTLPRPLKQFDMVRITNIDTGSYELHEMADTHNLFGG